MLTYKTKEYKIGLCCSSQMYTKTLMFDYIELPVTEIMKWNHNQLDNTINTMSNVLAANKLFPSNLQLIGSHAQEEAIVNYVKEAMNRLYRLGVKIVVFGSGRSRNYPSDYTSSEALNDLIVLTRKIADIAKTYDISIAMEPLSSETSNILNNLKETYDFVKKCNHPSVAIAADYYHMRKVGDNIDSLYTYRKHILHFHLCTSDRGLPGSIEENESKVFEGLTQVDSVRTISIEATLTEKDNYQFVLNYLVKKTSTGVL